MGTIRPVPDSGRRSRSRDIRDVPSAQGLDPSTQRTGRRRKSPSRSSRETGRFTGGADSDTARGTAPSQGVRFMLGLKRWFSKRRNNGDIRARVEQEAKLKDAERATPFIQRSAAKIAALPAEEYVERARRAFNAGGGQ